MNCAMCDGDLIDKRGPFPFRSRSLGNVFIPDVSFSECVLCGDKTISPDESEKLINYVRIPTKLLIARFSSFSSTGFSRMRLISPKRPFTA